MLARMPGGRSRTDRLSGREMRYCSNSADLAELVAVVANLAGELPFLNRANSIDAPEQGLLLK
jgi:hypothetical protein